MDKLNPLLTKIDSNPYIATSIKVIFILFAGQIAYDLPPFLKTLLENDIFKVLVIVLLAIIISQDVSIGVIVATVFLISLVGLNRIHHKEAFDQLQQLLYIEGFKAEQERNL